MTWRDDVTDEITTYFAANYNAMKEYILGHKSEHITGGVDPIPVATTVTAGLCPVLDGFSGHYLSGIGTFSAPAGGGGTGTPPPIMLWPLGAIIPTSSPSIGDDPIRQVELSGGINYVFGAFSSTISNYLQWIFVMPNTWNGLAVQIRIFWYSPGDTEGMTARWNVLAKRFENHALFNSTLASILVVEDTVFTGIGNDRIMITDPASATIGGSGNYVVLEVRRNWVEESNPAANVRLLAIMIEYVNA